MAAPASPPPPPPLSAYSSEPYTQELPVDLPLKAEHSQKRLGAMVLSGVLALLLFGVFLLSVNLGFLIGHSIQQLPKVSELAQWRPSESSQLFDRNGQVVAVISGDEDRVVLPLNTISPFLPRAIMAIEDNRFYHHSGVDVRGTLRAIASNVRGGDVQGGSTLTQQLVKNLYLSRERSLGRKVAEALLALRIEKQYDKNKILELYLNIVYWGNQAYGAEKAARRYFNTSASQLSLGQAALLAGLLKAPEGLSPFAYPQAALRRQKEVLGAMETFGFISSEERRKAAEEVIVFHGAKNVYQHPYFVDHVLAELSQWFGSDVVRRGGLRVTTSMDIRLQAAAEQALAQGLAKAGPASRVEQGALVALGVKDGTLLALVGGANYAKSQFNNATLARRPAGSTFKPFIYLSAFRQGWLNANSIVVDRPIKYRFGAGYWQPKNWDGVFLGPLTVRMALAKSRNTTTLQVGQRVGIEAVIKTAQLAGIHSPIDANFSSFLGSSGVSPLEMATAYGTFARGGLYLPNRSVLKVEDSQGRPIPLPATAAERVFEAGPVAELNEALQTVVEQGTAKPAMIPGQVVRGKTGTTDKVRDIWFAGFTPDFVGVVWMGHSKNLPLLGVFSSNCVGVWRQFGGSYYRVPSSRAKP
jgi:1A family penicillin-binding protein